MEIKKGRITGKGQIEQTKNGSHLLHVTVQIGQTKTFNKYTGEPEDAKEEVDYTFWHDDARTAEQNVNVGDVVELELDHYVDRQWHRTVCITRNLKVITSAPVAKPVTQSLTEGMPKKEDLIKQPQEAAQGEGSVDDLPF